MHRLYQRTHELSKEVIGACIEVHRVLGPGLIESVYERCLMRELELRGLAAVNQQKVTIEYKGLVFDEVLKFDVLVENCLLVELKAVESVLPVHKAKLLSYMKLLDVPLGLVVNFHEVRLVDGISRLILPEPINHPTALAARTNDSAVHSLFPLLPSVQSAGLPYSPRPVGLFHCPVIAYDTPTGIQKFSAENLVRLLFRRAAGV